MDDEWTTLNVLIIAWIFDCFIQQNYLKKQNNDSMGFSRVEMKWLTDRLVNILKSNTAGHSQLWSFLTQTLDSRHFCYKYYHIDFKNDQHPNKMKSTYKCKKIERTFDTIYAENRLQFLVWKVCSSSYFVFSHTVWQNSV